MSASVRYVVEDGQGEASKATDVHLVGSEPCGGAHGVVVGKFYVRQVEIPILSLIDGHS